jgi:hypothetical protein
MSRLQHLAYCVGWTVWTVLLLFVIFTFGWLFTSLIALVGCSSVPGDPFAINRPSEMHAVCLRLVDVDGKIYERTAWFNDEGFGRALRDWKGYALAGICGDSRPHKYN